MRGIFLIRSRLSLLRAPASRSITTFHYSSDKSIVRPCLLDPPSACTLPLSLSSSFSTSRFDSELAGSNHSNDSNDNDDDEDEEEEIGCSTKHNESVVSEDVRTISKLLKECGSNRKKLREKLEECGVNPSNELVVEILSLSRNDWETAFTFFLWSGKHRGGYVRSVREYHSMISILGKMRKFDTAWTLIEEMKKKFRPSLVSSQTLLIMIRKYCAVRDVGRAINTFHAYKRFELPMGIDEFQSLLSALCRYKNVQDAEHLIYCNKDTYPFDAKSFNIVLNGWCNVIGSPRQAERVWMEMGNVGVEHDVVSYSCMMSCYSKGGNLSKVLRLFDRMKREGVEADRKVYNAVVHALAKGGFVSEAVKLMKTMEEEKGMELNVVSYNSLIKPLCKAKKTEEAKRVFEEMIERGVLPTIRTYHAFMRILRTGDEVFELLDKMTKMGCEPTVDTFIMLIRKFCRWRDFDNVALLWEEMKERGVGPDLSSYVVMIHGLFLNGKVDEAHGYYKEMKEKGFRPNEKAEELIQSWFEGKQYAEKGMVDLKGNVSGVDKEGVVKKTERGNFLQEPEVRRVVRGHGYSFWDE
ncbi:Pentatricopeptide repeat-containing protein [Raphanus sativus]|uniref:Pentatricopeptide repeat-containing protein At5g15010, mitochondrial n=1 Tax=Raphanus sativus TaxID=3726 RepID=A0A6J0MDT4_RAPSA|nr:pentatricopeptide repeat-containing protein At5g15010, mitochondrial [Raphanus sativus]KAJ4912070.1 Pentatricopeptide repeat-containing protein [Raphanus sativus]